MTSTTFDGQTVEQLAQWIGDAYTGGQLRGFFARAGVRVPPHDGSTKWRWVLPILQELNRKPGGLETVILRLVDPKEHSGDRGAIQTAHRRMNDLLAVEGWGVQIDGVQPRLKKTTPRLLEEEPKITEFVPAEAPQFTVFVGDPALEAILRERWHEAQACVFAEAYLSAIVAMGGILEACLLSVAVDNPEPANRSASAPKNRDGKNQSIHEWSLKDLIEIAHDCGWIQVDARDFSHALRDYRNMVHPWHQRTKAFRPDRDTCAVLWEVVKAAMNDLVLRFSPAQQHTSEHIT